MMVVVLVLVMVVVVMMFFQLEKEHAFADKFRLIISKNV